MQQMASSNRTVTVQVLRRFWHGGRWVDAPEQVQTDYINARGLQHTGKGVIVADPVPAEERTFVVADTSAGDKTDDKRAHKRKEKSDAA